MFWIRLINSYKWYKWLITLWIPYHVTCLNKQEYFSCKNDRSHAEMILILREYRKKKRENSKVCKRKKYWFERTLWKKIIMTVRIEWFYIYHLDQKKRWIHISSYSYSLHLMYFFFHCFMIWIIWINIKFRVNKHNYRL